MIRANITFSDGCGRVLEQFPNGRSDMAENFAERVCDIHKDAEYCLEYDCPQHGWEDLRSCEMCSEPVCSDPRELTLNRYDHGGSILCEECASQCAEDAEDPNPQGVTKEGACGVR